MAKQKKQRLGRGLSSLMAGPVAVDVAGRGQPAGGVSPRENGGDVAQGEPVGPGKEEVVGTSQASGAAQGAGAMQDATSGEGTAEVRGLTYIEVELIDPNRYQPRQSMDVGAIDNLAASIRQDGIMQPIVVRPGEEGGRYELVAGERRWRAAQVAGLERVPAIVRELDDRQLAEWAVVENLQREDLNPIERARAFERLIDHFGQTHEEVADRVGIERPTVSNYLRLLDLHDDVQDMVGRGMLSAGHARTLLGLGDREQQLVVARKAVAAGWSVRSLEAAVRRMVRGSGVGAKGSARNAAYLKDLEEQISAQLKTKVKVRQGRKKGTGIMSIAFFDLDQFDSLLRKLGVEVG